MLKIDLEKIDTSISYKWIRFEQAVDFDILMCVYSIEEHIRL